MVHFAERGDVFVKTSVGGPNRGWLKYHKDGTVSQPPFWSVSRSMWWCIATLTTVGYGDETPQTNSGKIIGAFTMVSGILIIALPVSVLGTNFSVAYQKAVDVKGEKRGCDTSVKCHVLCVWEQYTNERLPLFFLDGTAAKLRVRAKLRKEAARSLFSRHGTGIMRTLSRIAKGGPAPGMEVRAGGG